MKIRHLAFAFVLIASPSLAQQPSPTERYWQQIFASTSTASAAQIVNMAKEIDDLKAQLALAHTKCKAPEPPKDPAQ